MFEPEFSLIQLHYFAEVARAGSMTEAVKRLHISQPVLSSSINQLERVPRRRVRRTSAGRQFYLDGITMAGAEGDVHLEHYREGHTTVPFNVNNRCPVQPWPLLAPL